MAHTPGPWTHDEGDPHMVAGDPETMFDCYYVFDANGNCVAIIPDDPYLGLSVLDNIKLIDASPDLLAAARLSKREDVNLLFVAADELQRAGRMEYAIQLRKKAWAEEAAIKQAEGK